MLGKPCDRVLRILAVAFFGTGIVQAKTVPVCDDPVNYPEYHRLDFMIGTWSAYAGKDRIADVSIERASGACALVQTWSAPPSKMTLNRPAVSKALIAYDQDRKLWEMFWVTGVIGTHFHLTAVPSKNLLWKTTEVLAGGRTKTDHLVITKLSDGTLRQIVTASTDGGKSWATGYDLIWRRK